MYKKSESDISVCYTINRADIGEVVVGTLYVCVHYWYRVPTTTSPISALLMVQHTEISDSDFLYIVFIPANRSKLIFINIEVNFSKSVCEKKDVFQNKDHQACCGFVTFSAIQL